MPENQLCTILEYDKNKKKKTIIQSIVLFCGTPKGLLTMDFNVGSYLKMFFFFLMISFVFLAWYKEHL